MARKKSMAMLVAAIIEGLTCNANASGAGFFENSRFKVFPFFSCFRILLFGTLFLGAIRRHWPIPIGAQEVKLKSSALKTAYGEAVRVIHL